MSITSSLGNTKADKAKKLANLLGAHHRSVRHQGQVYYIEIQKVGSMVLGSGTETTTKAVINLMDKTTVAKELKKLCENRLYS
jgi:hypothetical protein